MSAAAGSGKVRWVALSSFAGIAGIAGVAAIVAAIVALIASPGSGPLGRREPARGGAREARGEVHEALGEELDRFMGRLEAFGFSGSVLVASHGRILLDKGYGLADREHGIPYSAGTLFDLASISKQFTAAAVLALEMDGRLKVEDPLGKYFSDAPPDKAGITLHQLLTHTSGLKDGFGPEYEPIGRDELVRRALASELLLPPGRRFRYSNAGYSLLAAVVEVVAGRPLGDFMRERLFLPAGMRHTGHRLPARDGQPLAHGYGAGADWGTPLDHPWAADGPYWNLRGNGGVLSTTGDLYRWHLALAGEAVLSRQEKEKYFTPYVSEGQATHSRYAYGWSVTRSPTGTRLLSHIGGNGVFEADFRRYVEDEAVLVMSSNSVDVSALAVSPHVEARLFHLPDPEPPATAPLNPAAAARCAGEYALPSPSQERLRVEARAGRLALIPQGPAGFALLAGTMSAEQREISAAREEKVRAALSGLQRGDFAPYADALGIELPAAIERGRAELIPLRRALGAWTGNALLGSAVLGGHPYTFARLTFARGGKLAALLWEGPTVETIHFRDEPAAFVFLPLPPTPAATATAGQPSAAGQVSELAFYEVRDGTQLRIRCEPGPGGQGELLVIPTPAGEARLPRI